jgi:hypothetical protein
VEPITLQDLVPYDEYERQRGSYRERIIALKRWRRISVGDKVTLVFENRDTLRFQIQEIIRVERITDPEKIQDELGVYNTLLPGPGELSATLLIELTDPDTMKHWLDLFMGLDHGRTVGLRVGNEVVYGIFEGGHSHETKISAVHFVRFAPSDLMVRGLGDPATRVALTVHHNSYDAEVDVPWEMRQEWLADLGHSGTPTNRR